MESDFVICVRDGKTNRVSVKTGASKRALSKSSAICMQETKWFCERIYFGAELNLAQAQLDERLALVQLYNALGGGWQQ